VKDGASKKGFLVVTKAGLKVISEHESSAEACRAMIEYVLKCKDMTAAIYHQKNGKWVVFQFFFPGLIIWLC
jgi:hypothetical protein